MKKQISRSRRLAACLVLAAALGLAGSLAVAQETATAPAAFLSRAPQGTWAALHINGPKIAGSQLVQNIMVMSGQDPTELNEMAEITFYALPLEGPIQPGMKFPFCGVVKVDAEAQAEADGKLMEAGAEKVTIDGMTAYRIRTSQLAALGGAQLPPQAPDTAFVVGKAADGTFLVGSDDAALKAVKASSTGATSAALTGLNEAVGGRDESAICLAVYVEGGLKTLIPPDEVQGTPPFVQNMRGAGIGLVLDTGLGIETELLTGSSMDAATVMGMIQQGLAQAKQGLADTAAQNPGMAQVAQQISPLIDKVSVKTEDMNVVLSFALTDAEIGQLMMLGMGLAMQAQAAAGGAAAPGGMGMPPAAP